MNKSNIPTTITGAMCELIASAWLLKNGYEVFKNVSPTGKADLIALKNGNTILIDVTKSNKYYHKDGKISFSRNSIKEKKCNKLNIKVLYVSEDDCFFAKEYEPEKILHCEECNKEFLNTNNKTRFCSKKCRDTYYSLTRKLFK